MSLTVPAELLEQAKTGDISDADFDCIRTSLPYAWTAVSRLAAQLSADGAGHGADGTPPPSDEDHAQLLRLVGSDAMRAAVERHFGYHLAFQNCCKVGLFAHLQPRRTPSSYHPAPRSSTRSQRSSTADDRSRPRRSVRFQTQAGPASIFEAGPVMAPAPPCGALPGLEQCGVRNGRPPPAATACIPQRDGTVPGGSRPSTMARLPGLVPSRPERHVGEPTTDFRVSRLFSEAAEGGDDHDDHYTGRRDAGGM